jgi:hypothetical protein
VSPELADLLGELENSEAAPAPVPPKKRKHVIESDDEENEEDAEDEEAASEEPEVVVEESEASADDQLIIAAMKTPEGTIDYKCLWDGLSMASSMKWPIVVSVPSLYGLILKCWEQVENPQWKVRRHALTTPLLHKSARSQIRDMTKLSPCPLASGILWNLVPSLDVLTSSSPN